MNWPLMSGWPAGVARLDDVAPAPEVVEAAVAKDWDKADDDVVISCSTGVAAMMASGVPIQTSSAGWPLRSWTGRTCV